MLPYYLSLAFRSFRRDAPLTSLMVTLIGLGVAASMVLIAQLLVITADPIPTRGGQLFAPSVDARTSNHVRVGSTPPVQLTWTDAMAFLKKPNPPPQAAMTGGRVTVIPASGRGHSFFASARYTTSGIFQIFDIPMTAGNAWSSRDDSARARVAVVSHKIATKVYGSTNNAVGSILNLNGSQFTVVGVMGDWNPKPHFYDVEPGAYQDSEDIFLPLLSARELKLPTMGSITCWGEGLPTKLETSPCAWIQFWVRLVGEKEVKAYRQFLVQYSLEQERLGRFELPENVHLYSVRGLLNQEHAVPSQPKLQLGIAICFLIFCIFNAAALLLAKFLKKRPDLAVRRALGATKTSIFLQLIVEAASVGLFGSILAMCLLPMGLWVIHQQTIAYAPLVSLNVGLFFLTVFFAFVASCLAGIYPAWNACRAAPATFIKVQ